jgi:hypothetical protein
MTIPVDKFEKCQAAQGGFHLEVEPWQVFDREQQRVQLAIYRYEVYHSRLPSPSRIHNDLPFQILLASTSAHYLASQTQGKALNHA